MFIEWKSPRIKHLALSGTQNGIVGTLKLSPHAGLRKVGSHNDEIAH